MATKEIKNDALWKDFIQLARTAMVGRTQDIQLFLHKICKRYSSTDPQMTEAIVALLQELPNRSSPLRKNAEAPLPVDLDSRLKLLKVENDPLDHELILQDDVEKQLKQFVAERQNAHSLIKLGLTPAKTLLFTGPPGVGKTMAARWLSQKMGRPLLVLDLAAVMSSFLGRTGNNIRFVLDYAKSTECILLLDEIDAIAKRRDDTSEIGELKRLVTVLLQEIDDWPASGILVAATNHPDLLDPALWRRFDVVLEFQNPTQNQIESFVSLLLSPYFTSIENWSKVLGFAFKGKSFSEIERQILWARKWAALNSEPLEVALQRVLSLNSVLTREEQIEFACLLIDAGLLSQRQTQELTGIARDTIRKYCKSVKLTQNGK